MQNYSTVFQKQKRTKTHEEIEFHNSIQDLYFTTVYRLQKSVWKNARQESCFGIFFAHYCASLGFFIFLYFLSNDQLLHINFLTNKFFLLPLRITSLKKPFYGISSLLRAIFMVFVGLILHFAVCSFNSWQLHHLKL